MRLPDDMPHSVKLSLSKNLSQASNQRLSKRKARIAPGVHLAESTLEAAIIKKLSLFMHYPRLWAFALLVVLTVSWNAAHASEQVDESALQAYQLDGQVAGDDDVP